MIRDLFISLWFCSRQIARSNKKSVTMTIMVVSMLFINILFISSMINGLIDSIDNQLVDFQYGNIMIEPSKESKSDDYIKQVGQKLDDIRKMPGVVGAVEHYKANIRLTFDPEKDGNNIKDGNWPIESIVPSQERKVMGIASHMVSGRYLEDGDRDKIVLGREISGGFGASFEQKSLQGAKVGDDVYAYYQNGTVRKYEVVGIFSTKSFVSDTQAFVTKDEMEDVLGQHDVADNISVKIADTGGEDRYISKIKNILGEDFKYYSWVDYSGSVASTTKSFDLVRIIFYFIGLAVSGASIFIIIYIDLINQKRQIGILKAIGMKGGIIITSYVLQAFFYGFVGIIIGNFLIKYAIGPYFSNHPFNFPIGDVSLGVREADLWRTEISMIVVSVISGFIPSVQIAKKNILDSIFR